MPSLFECYDLFGSNAKFHKNSQAWSRTFRFLLAVLFLKDTDVHLRFVFEVLKPDTYGVNRRRPVYFLLVENDKRASMKNTTSNGKKQANLRIT